MKVIILDVVGYLTIGSVLWAIGSLIRVLKRSAFTPEKEK